MTARFVVLFKQIVIFSMLSLIHVGPKITDDRSVLGSRPCVSFNTQEINCTYCRCTDQK